MGTLYIVATPIGNLEDLTLRALRILKEADLVLCEDTRVTKKLLSHFSIAVPVASYHQHSAEDKKQYILQLLSEGKKIALVTDSGTPGISDPGNELIAYLGEKAADLRIVPIPGPSAVAAIASVSGFPMNQFLFLGYPPHKKGRKAFFEEIAQSKYPVVFYEAPYRILKSMEELAAADSSLQVVVGRELTKQFETILRGTIEEILSALKSSAPRGEFAVVVYRG